MGVGAQTSKRNFLPIVGEVKLIYGVPNE